MMPDCQEVPIVSRDFWFKIVGFLQQNWALIDGEDDPVTVWFLSDTGGIFDRLAFTTGSEAEGALMRNGFRRFADDKRAQTFLSPPHEPFNRSAHPNGPIYSSGHFWKSSS